MNEIVEQIAKVDLLLQEAYEAGNTDDAILFAQLMAKLMAKKASLEGLMPKDCQQIQAWKNAGINPACENRILSRDEREMLDF